MSSSSKFASSFAPYTPPPDAESNPKKSSPPPRPWFPHHASSIEASSYQSGGIPTFGDSVSGVNAGSAEEAETQTNVWETRLPLRVDVLAAIAYIFGPLSALALLILETTNDYVRFHAYQSALLTTPLLGFRMLASLVGFTPWLRTLLTWIIVLSAWFMAFKAFRDASQNDLSHYHLPFLGEHAERFLSNE